MIDMLRLLLQTAICRYVFSYTAAVFSAGKRGKNVIEVSAADE